MSEEIPTMTAAINKAIGEYLHSNSGGVMTNFVFVAEFMDSDGGNSTAVVGGENASTSSLIGLSHYGVNFYSELQRRDVLEVIYCDVEDEEE